MYHLDKHEFISELEGIPYWVNSEADMLNYCKHLKYRLAQNREAFRWYQTQFQLSEIQHEELDRLFCFFDRFYTESKMNTDGKLTDYVDENK